MKAVFAVLALVLLASGAEAFGKWGGRGGSKGGGHKAKPTKPATTGTVEHESGKACFDHVDNDHDGQTDCGTIRAAPRQSRRCAPFIRAAQV